MRLGIHPRTLYALRDAGEIEQLGRGLYRLSKAPPLSSPDLVPIAIRIPQAVVCLLSALAHQDRPWIGGIVRHLSSVRRNRGPVDGARRPDRSTVFPARSNQVSCTPPPARAPATVYARTPF